VYLMTNLRRYSTGNHDERKEWPKMSGGLIAESVRSLLELTQLDGCSFDSEMVTEIGIEIEDVVAGQRKEVTGCVL